MESVMEEKPLNGTATTTPSVKFSEDNCEISLSEPIEECPEASCLSETLPSDKVIGADYTFCFTRTKGTMYSLTGIYAEIVLVVTVAILCGELMDDSIPLFYIQDYVLLCLTGVSCIILAVSIPMLYSHKASLQSAMSDDCKYRSRHCSNTLNVRTYKTYVNMYLKTGIFVFGVPVIFVTLLTTFVAFTPNCVGSPFKTQAILSMVFTALQLICLRLSKGIMTVWRSIKPLVLMHLFATNLAIWLRELLRECANDWTSFYHIQYNSSLRWDKSAPNFIAHAYKLNEDSSTHVIFQTSGNCHWTEMEADEPEISTILHCFQNSTSGQHWRKTNEHLFPFLSQFYLLMSCFLFIHWSNINKVKSNQSLIKSYKQNHPEEADSFCSRSTKGLFFGVCVIVFAVIVTIADYSLPKDKDFLVGVFYIVVLLSATIAPLLGFFSVGKMKEWSYGNDLHFIKLFQKIGLFSVIVYSCVLILGSLKHDQCILYGFVALATLVQGIFQYLFVIRIAKLKIDAATDASKPGRQVVVFLICCNVALMIVDCFANWGRLSTALKELNSSPLWLVVSRCVLPIVVFYRHHSAFTLMYAWRKVYNRDELVSTERI